ncbi:MAG: TIR domain-containing protein [Chitinophagaceae bacterium]
MKQGYKYDVAISFAEEDRDAALALVLALEMEGIKKVYYYPDKQGEHWGEELKSTLTRIYKEEARFVIVLLSNHYFNPEKKYTKVEFEAITARIESTNNSSKLLSVNMGRGFSLDKYPYLAGKFCLDWNHGPKKIAKELVRKIGKHLNKNQKNTGKGKVINNSGDQVLFILDGNIKNFNQQFFNKDGK